MEKDDKIMKGSHNSGTGEPSKNIWHAMLVPFARCQSKTIAEQWQNDVRLFDLRIDADGTICHGLWKSKTTLIDIMKLLNTYNRHGEVVHFIITFEGKPSAGEEAEFFEDMMFIFKSDKIYDWAVLDSLWVKKPKWRGLWYSKDAWTYLQHYTKIIGWKCLLPIPWLWNKINRFPVDNTDTEMRDFI